MITLNDLTDRQLTTAFFRKAGEIIEAGGIYTTEGRELAEHKQNLENEILRRMGS